MRSHLNSELQLIKKINRKIKLIIMTFITYHNRIKDEYSIRSILNITTYYYELNPNSMFDISFHFFPCIILFIFNVTIDVMSNDWCHVMYLCFVFIIHNIMFHVSCSVQLFVLSNALCRVWSHVQCYAWYVISCLMTCLMSHVISDVISVSSYVSCYAWCQVSCHVWYNVYWPKKKNQICKRNSFNWN